MKTLQMFHNKCAKPVYNMKQNDSSPKALGLLHWKTLDARRKLHRCDTIYESIEGLTSVQWRVNISTVEPVQYSGGLAPVQWRLFSTAEGSH